MNPLETPKLNAPGDTSLSGHNPSLPSVPTLPTTPATDSRTSVSSGAAAEYEPLPSWNSSVGAPMLRGNSAARAACAFNVA